MPSVRRFDEQRVNAFGVSFSVPGCSAATWIRALRSDSEHLAGIFPGLVEDGTVDHLLALWLEYPDAGRRCELAARKLLGRAAGMDWIWAWNLMCLCLRGWIFVNGMLLRQGVNAHKMSLGDWLTAAYTLIYESRDEAGRIALEQELSTPPRGVRLIIPAEVQHRAALAFALD
jgi:hypothetical protein